MNHMALQGEDGEGNVPLPARSVKIFCKWCTETRKCLDFFLWIKVGIYIAMA